jgi:hypothetical protein
MTVLATIGDSWVDRLVEVRGPFGSRYVIFEATVRTQLDERWGESLEWTSENSASVALPSLNIFWANLIASGSHAGISESNSE